MQWEQWRNNSDALVAGPIPAGEYTTLPVALQPSDVALQGSFTIYLGANRGRGSYRRRVCIHTYQAYIRCILPEHPYAAVDSRPRRSVTGVNAVDVGERPSDSTLGS